MLPLALVLILSQSPEDSRLAGRWKDAELKLVSEFTRAPDGKWSAVVISSPRASEVGKRTFENVVWEEKTQVFKGTLIKPVGGQKVDVTLSLDSENAMTGKASIFIFKKVLHFTRVVADAGTPEDIFSAKPAHTQ